MPTDKLLRYAGKQWRGGKTAKNRSAEEVKDFIQVNRYTGIQGYLYDAKTGKYAEVGEEPLFRKYVLRGEPLEVGDIARTNYVWLATWFRTNYEHHYVRTVDLTFHRHLRKPIAKALYPLLATGWYASKGQPYEKSYRALCQKFLLKEHQHESLIRQQLDPALQELQGYLKRKGSKDPQKVDGMDFLAKREFRRAADGQDWIITFHAGDKFFRDQQAMLSRRDLAHSLPSKISSAAVPTASSPAYYPEDVAYFVDQIAKALGYTSSTPEDWVEPNKGTQSFTALSNVIVSNEL